MFSLRLSWGLGWNVQKRGSTGGDRGKRKADEINPTHPAGRSKELQTCTVPLRWSRQAEGARQKRWLEFVYLLWFSLLAAQRIILPFLPKKRPQHLWDLFRSCLFLPLFSFGSELLLLPLGTCGGSCDVLCIFGHIKITDNLFWVFGKHVLLLKCSIRLGKLAQGTDVCVAATSLFLQKSRIPQCPPGCQLSPANCRSHASSVFIGNVLKMQEMKTSSVHFISV